MEPELAVASVCRWIVDHRQLGRVSNVDTLLSKIQCRRYFHRLLGYHVRTIPQITTISSCELYAGATVCQASGFIFFESFYS